MFVGWRLNQRKYCHLAQGVHGSDDAVGAMATCDAEDGRTVWYVKFCPVGGETCKNYAWDKFKWGYTKDEAVAKFREHLAQEHRIFSVEVAGSLCDALVFGTYIDHGIEEPHRPSTTLWALTPKLPAVPPQPVKKTLAEEASASSKRRRVEPPDESP